MVIGTGIAGSSDKQVRVLRRKDSYHDVQVTDIPRTLDSATACGREHGRRSQRPCFGTVQPPACIEEPFLVQCTTILRRYLSLIGAVMCGHDATRSPISHLISCLLF